MHSAADIDSHGVKILTDANWDEEIATKPHFVMFHAPWCGQCKKLQPFWDKIPGSADSFKVQIAKIDATAHNKISNKFDIKAYPTLKLIGLTPLGAEVAVKFELKQLKGDGKEDVQLAKFADKASEDIEKALAEQQAAEAHLAATEKATKDKQEAEADDHTDRLTNGQVLTLTKKTFAKQRKLYTQGKKQFMVKFYLPTCKTCIELAPRFAGVAAAAKGDSNIILGTVDCEAQKEVCTEEGIPSYPVIITFNADNMAGEWPGAVFEKATTAEVMAQELGVAKSKLSEATLALDVEINKKIAAAAEEEAAKKGAGKEKEQNDEL